MANPRALVLITVDCLRADHTGFMGYARPTTPFLDSLASESIVVRNAMVAGAPTYYSFPAIMASRHPLALGRDVVGLAPHETTLASALHHSGYSTAAFVAANPYLSRRFGYDAGFETFEDFLKQDVHPLTSENSRHSRLNRKLSEISRRVGLGAIYDEAYFQYCQRLASAPAKSFDQLRRFPAADVVVEEACHWLRSVDDRPFFLWIHLMDPHAPYYPPEKAIKWMDHHKLDAGRARYLNSYWNRGDLKNRRLNRKRTDIIALYDAGIRWVDSQVERLVDNLRSLGRWNNCVFALTADHGEEFLDHGGRYHSPAKLTEELLHVPLLLRVPGHEKTPSTDAPFSLLHLAPTLLDATGNAIPESFRGQSYWPQLDKAQSWQEPAVIECVMTCTNPFRQDDRVGPRILGVRDHRYFLVLDFRSAESQLFDMMKDPHQQNPLPLTESKPVRKRLLEVAREHVVRSRQAHNSDHRLQARLRELRLEWASV